jgi:hypothetical protein
MSKSETDRKSRCLLVVPTSFYTFAQILAQALESHGYEVVVANDEYPNNVIGKILGTLRIQRLLNRLTLRAFKARFLGHEQHYELVLIVKGRGVGSALLQELRSHADRIVAYNFDSFGYHPAPLAWYREVDRYCTFDVVDAREHNLPRVDLFSSLPVAQGDKQRVYDVSAILRNHSDRLRYVHQVLHAIGPAQVFIYIFEKNVFTFAYNFVRNPLLYVRYWKSISFKSLPYPQYVSVLQLSNVTIDFAHPKQSGITIRCFEALSAGTKIITNNPHVLACPGFGENNVMVVQPGQSDMAGVRAAYERLCQSVAQVRHRTIKAFLEELIRPDNAFRHWEQENQQRSDQRNLRPLE